MNNTIHKSNKNLAIHIFPQLKLKKEEDNQTAFNELIEPMLAGIKRYLSRRLKFAVRKKTIPSGKYKVEDFLDELYILAYDHLQEVKEDKELYRWLFGKADELFENTVVEEDFDHIFYENIDNFAQPEWDAMEENFTTDGDGDLIMEEELDDISYPKFDYTLKDVFVENIEEGILEKLEKDLTQEKIRQQVDWVLNHLPASKRTVFDLHVQEKLTLKEIATIKKSSIAEIANNLSKVQQLMQVSFTNRFNLKGGSI